MNQILLGYERLAPDGTGWNFNGRIERSTIPLDPTLIQTDYDREMYNLLLEPESYSDTSGVFNYINHPHKPNTKLASEITTEKYAYLIELRNMVVIKCISHFAISDKVLNDARTGQAYIIILYHNEGNIGHCVDKLRSLVDQLNIPKEQVFFLHGDHDVEAYKDEPYTYVPVNCFPYWVQQFKRNKIIDFVPNKLYNCYNRRIRPHRIIMLSLLHHYNLIDSGIVSCGPDLKADLSLNDTLSRALMREVDDSEIQFFNTISDTSPDNLSLGVENPAINLIDSHYRNTFVSVINETLTDSLFFSEKIYKPILIGHPFLLMGAPNQLTALKKFGFKTFSDWWDEDYDQITDMNSRAKHIVDILVSLNNKSSQELITLREEMRPVLMHNQTVFNDIVSNNMYGYIKPIHDFLVKVFNG